MSRTSSTAFSDLHTVFLIVDQVYPKTLRHLEKLRRCIGPLPEVVLAEIEGFDEGLSLSTVEGHVDKSIRASVKGVAQIINRLRTRKRARTCHIVALNQSAILPAEAVRALTGSPVRRWAVAACDKRLMRERLSRDQLFATPFRAVIPGCRTASIVPLQGATFVIKPAFGMSGRRVSIISGWKAAVELAACTDNVEWLVPANVLDALGYRANLSNMRLIEPYFEGVEFSVDGWKHTHGVDAVVQHKLCVLQRQFIGDGPTVSPPAARVRRVGEWAPMKSTERKCARVVEHALRLLGCRRGVFHAEFRELDSTRLQLIEVNPRAPGGSLWRSAMLRTGVDLEQRDAEIQLGMRPPRRVAAPRGHALHVPFYASGPGILRSWNGLTEPSRLGIGPCAIDYAVRLRHKFKRKDMIEEPYLAFVTAAAASTAAALRKCAAIVNAKAPTIESRAPATARPR